MNTLQRSVVVERSKVDPFGDGGLTPGALIDMGAYRPATAYLAQYELLDHHRFRAQKKPGQVEFEVNGMIQLAHQILLVVMQEVEFGRCRFWQEIMGQLALLTSRICIPGEVNAMYQ